MGRFELQCEGVLTSIADSIPSVRRAVLQLVGCQRAKDRLAASRRVVESFSTRDVQRPMSDDPRARTRALLFSVCDSQ